MNQEKQSVTDSNNQVTESRKWLNATLGIFLLCRRIIGATGKTYLGRFLAYSFSYCFGIFYPLARILIGIYGIRLIYAKKGLARKRYGRTWVGGVLFFLCLLAFASFSIFAGDETINISSLNASYTDLRHSFARYPFQIDNFGSLSGLGGGFIGLFLVTLFGSIWKATGDRVFFVLLFIASLGLILFHPIVNEMENLRRKKEKRVNYSSSFQKQKNKEHTFLHRSNEKKPKVEEPLPQFNRQKQATVVEEEKLTPITKEERKPVLDALKTKEEEKPALKKEESSYSLNEEDRNRSANRFRQAAMASSEPQQEQEANPSFVPPHQEPVEKVFVSEQKPNPFAQFASRQKEEPKVEENKPAEKPVAAKPEPIAPQPKPFTPAPVVENPLDGPFHSRKDAYKESFSQEVAIDEDKPRQDAPEFVETTAPVKEVEKELTEEEKEDELVKKYFDDKHKRESDRLEERRRKERLKKAQYQEYTKETLAYNYPFPTDELLDEHDDSAKIQLNQEAAQKKAVIINNALKDFGIRARATSFTIGASVTRFNVLTDSGEKADKIASLTDDLQRYLNGDKSVRVETVVEGRSTSGIEVGNQAPRAVSFKDVFQKVETNTSDSLLLPIGKDISGEIVTYPLNKRPHLLVAGSTGSGKSVLIHSRIATLLMRNYPNQRKLRLIDPKQVEFGLYKDCPHLLCPVISNPSQAIRALAKLCVERDRRFSLLSANRCVNHDDYNKLRIKSPELGLEERPAIVCIIDEFADLRQTGGKELPEYVCRIAQKARAAGIYLIIATQRPDRDVVPSLIKSNIACRIGLRCASRVNSQVILDENGAETLLGKGDLLFKCPGKKSRIRCQSPYLSNEEIDRVLSYLKKYAGKPHYNPEFLDLEPAEKENALGTDGQVQDPEEFMYNSIKDFVCRTKRCNKALLRRTFRLTSQKASDTISRLLAERIIDRGPGGTYTPGISAEEYLQEHSN